MTTEAHRIKFQEINSAGYYHYLADHPELENGESARAAYAACLAAENRKNPTC